MVFSLYQHDQKTGQQRREDDYYDRLHYDRPGAERRGRDPLVRLEILLLNLRRVVVDSPLWVLHGGQHDHDREQEREYYRLDDNCTPDHCFSF